MGSWELAIATAGHLPGWLAKVEWYQLVENVAPARTSHGGPLVMRRGGLDDVMALTGVGHADAQTMRQRLEEGDRCFAAFDEGRAVAYNWYRSGCWREDDVEYLLADDERWSYDLFVHPSHRGRNIASALATHSLRELAAEGVTRVIAVIDHLNEASRRSAIRAGSRPIASLVTISVPMVGFLHERPDGTRQSRSTVYLRRSGVTRRPPRPAAR